MTLGNMRELGVRSLVVTCDLCHHQPAEQLFLGAHGRTCDGAAVEEGSDAVLSFPVEVHRPGC